MSPETSMHLVQQQNMQCPSHAPYRTVNAPSKPIDTTPTSPKKSHATTPPRAADLIFAPVPFAAPDPANICIFR